MASEWPEKYLVADEKDISKPSSKGLRYNGVPQVLSNNVNIFFFFASVTILERSWNSNVILPGFSTKIIFVFFVTLFFKSSKESGL